MFLDVPGDLLENKWFIIHNFRHPIFEILHLGAVKSHDVKESSRKKELSLVADYAVSPESVDHRQVAGKGRHWFPVNGIWT